MLSIDNSLLAPDDSFLLPYGDPGSPVIPFVSENDGNVIFIENKRCLEWKLSCHAKKEA